MVNNFEHCKSFSNKQLDNSKQFANLIRNGSFEELSNEKPANGMADWNATGLKDWSVWRKLNVCEYGIAKGAGVNGSTCIYVGSETTPKDTTGEIVGGLPNRQRETVVFLQSPSLQIGESYVIRLKTRVDNVREGRPHLAIRWRNAKNDGWELHHDLSFIAEPRVPGEWTTLEGFFTVPNNTAGISLQIGSTDTRGRVYFDDVELYKVE